MAGLQLCVAIPDSLGAVKSIMSYSGGKIMLAEGIPYCKAAAVPPPAVMQGPLS